MASSKNKMPEGKYFMAQGFTNLKFLTVQHGRMLAGTPVVITDKLEPRHDSQVWYDDEMTGTIRTKLNNLVLTVSDEGVLVVDHFKDVPNQKWTFDLWAGVLKNRVNPNQVLVVAAHNQESAEHAEPTGQDEQRWICTRIPNKYFTIVSEFCGMALEPESKMMGGVKAGAKLTTGPKDQKDNQLWYEDKNGVLRSKMKGMVLTYASKEQGARVILEDDYKEGNKDMEWQILPNKTIANRAMPTNVLDIKGQDAKKGAEIIVWQATGAKNQEWNVEYYKKKSKKNKTGDDDDDDSDSDED